jgi:hypothetical protein
VGRSSRPAPIAGPQIDAFTFSETVYYMRKQFLMHRDLWCPFSPIKAWKEVLYLNHLQSPEECWRYAGLLLMLSGASSKLYRRRSYLGARTPVRRKRRWMAANACDTVRISCTRLGSAPGTDVWRRCMSSTCQLTSLPATPRERHAGSLTGSN